MTFSDKESRVEIAIPSRPEFLRIVRLMVSGFASRLPISVDEVENLKVAVSEACNNAIQHAFEHGKEGVIKIKCCDMPGWIEFEVEDNGAGFSTGAGGDADESGLGFLLIQTLVDEVKTFSSPGKGTKILMRKKIPTG